MTQSEKVTNVQVLVQNDPRATDGVVSVYLSQAERTLLNHLYRAYGAVPEGATLPAINEWDQCELASRLFLRRGSQAEIEHSEAGYNRTYGSVDDQDILRRIMPYAKVM